MGVGMSSIVFLGGAFGFIYAIEKTKNSAAGVPVLLGFTFFMGLMLSRLIGHVLGFANGTALIMTAFAGTGGVFFGMATLVVGDQARPVDDGQVPLHRRDHAAGRRSSSTSSCSRRALFVTISVLMVGIFSAFILYDLKRVRDGPRRTTSAPR